MNCFPVDEEIQASIPFSNNSVVLAATSVLQQLLTLADERDLHSVDVLLTSIWLLLRDRRLNGEEQDLTDKVTHANLVQLTNKIDNDSFERTTQKTNGCTFKSNNLENRSNDDFSDANKVKNILSHSIGATPLEVNDNESASSGLTERDTSGDQASLNLCVTSELLSNKRVLCQTENVSTQTDTVQIIDNQNGRTNEDEKNHSLSTNLKCISEGSFLLNENKAECEKVHSSGSAEVFKPDAEETPVQPPVLYPQEIPKETVDDALNSNISSKYSLSPKAADISVNQDNGNADESGIENRDLSKPKVNADQISNHGLNFLNESESILKTSDGKTFQISSDDGFEDSFVIEKVDSDDSDDEMIDNIIEKSKVNGNNIAGDNTNAVEISAQGNVKLIQTGHNEINIDENFDETRKGQSSGEESSVNLGASVATSISTSPYIVSCTDITEKSMNKHDKSIGSYMENCDSTEPVNKSLLGGIISSDNDSELKIINIAGGVTFHDDYEDDFDSGNKMAYYVETKPDTSIYNPLSYSNYTPALSSCSSLYSNVVFSSYAGIPGTFMSADPRLAVQNCQPMFFPNNMNTVGMESVPDGRLYQPVANAGQYGNCQQNIPQGIQYFSPGACSSDLLQPMPVEIKSESKIIIPSKRSNSKKRKRRKSPEEGVCIKDYYYVKDPLTGKLKEYYNVRDPSGKFIKANRAQSPYINNIQKSPSRSSKGSHKTSIKEEFLSETSSDDAGQPAKPLTMINKQTSVDTTVSPGKLLENQTSPGYSDAQPGSASVEQTLRQLRGQKLQLDKKLKAILAKKKEEPKKNMTEREKKNHKAFETKRLNMLKKLHAEKKELAKKEVAERARLKSFKSPDIEYVVRDKGTHINSAGISKEYTVVTIKGLLAKPPVDQKDMLTDQGSTVKEEKKSFQTPQQQANSKKKPSLKQSKGKKSLKKAILAKETVRPVNLVSGSVPTLGMKTVVKSAKQKAAVKKVLKIKQSKTNLKQEGTSKSNKKSKQKVADNLVSDNLLKTIESQLTDTVPKNAGQTVSKKTKETSKKGKQNIHKVKTLINKKGASKTKRMLKKVTKAKPEVAVQDLISVHHGERGAKLAAQQRISAYNESEESNETVK